MALGRLEEMEGKGEGERESIENMLYQSFLSGKHCHGNSTHMLPLA